ncbi:MAG: hypothetical protein NZZ41_04635 [Candidatus Dojkabacteria bacterium]|nr:hypothetical protein [Candidatus Dojkabacteria bacterium]
MKNLLGSNEFDNLQPELLGNVQVPDEYYNRFFTGIPVLDNLFNGFVMGQVCTVSAYRGSGKTTFLMQLSVLLNTFNNVSTLFSSNEETLQQLAFTAKRISAVDNIYASHNSFVEDILPKFSEYKIIVIDSLSGLWTKNEEINSSDVSLYCLQNIYRLAKKNKNIVFLTLHMSKNKKVSIGKSALEHIVDTVIRIEPVEENEADTNGKGRKLIVEKNRMGSVGELWITLEKFGFDFTNVLRDDTKNNVDSSKSSSSQKQRQEDHAKIQEILKRQGKITNSDLTILSKNDPRVFERFERLLKTLEKMGSITKVGKEYYSVNSSSP